MNQEFTFRIIFIAVFVPVLLLSTYYRALARKNGGVIARRREGGPALLGRAIMALSLLTVIVLYALNPRWIDWAALSLPVEVRWFGACLGIACVPLLWWVLRSIGSNISETVLTKQGHQLVQKGPYRWVRHPLYSVGLLEIFALSLIADNWFLALLAFIGAIVFRYVIIPKEEARLIAAFDGEYEQYRKRTGALLPRF